MTTEFFIFGLARLTRICNPSTNSETSLKVMRYWKFSQKTKIKQKFFANSEKEVGNFFKTGTIVGTLHTLDFAITEIKRQNTSLIRKM